MPLDLDPLIASLIHDPVKRTSFLVAIDSVVPRRWTPFPSGITTDDGVRHLPLLVSVSGVLEELDASSPVTASITIPNADGNASDLLFDAANRRRPARISRVWFDGNWSLAGTELWFEGITGQASMRGPWLTLSCVAHAGRHGSSPTRSFSELMHSHRPPDNQRIRF